MISAREYRDLMKFLLRERDKFDKEIDLYFSLNEYIIIQMKAKNVVIICDELDQDLIIMQ